MAWLGAALGIGLAVLPAATALAVPNGHLQCRASALRVSDTNPSTSDVEPLVANRGSSRCRTDHPTAMGSATTGAQPPGTAVGSVAQTGTDLRPGNFHARAPVNGDGADASSSLGDVTITSGTTTIRARALSSMASVVCTGGVSSMVSSSQVLGITVNGEPVEQVDDTAYEQVPLGDGSTLHVNEKAASGGQLVQRALRLETPQGDIVVSEAGVAGVGAPCEDAAPPPPTIPSSRFDCSAVSLLISTTRGTPVGGTAPFAANADNRGCPDERQFAMDALFVNGDHEAAAMSAETDRQPDEPLPALLSNGDSAQSRVRTSGVTITLGTSTLEVQMAGAAATATCFGGAPVFRGTTRVTGLTLDGEPLDVYTNRHAISTPIGTIHVNSVGAASATAHGRYALWLQSSTLGNVILGAASVKAVSSPCI